MPPRPPNGAATPANESVPALSLDQAIEKIPASTRHQLDELFRGKFIRVERVPREKLR